MKAATTKKTARPARAKGAKNASAAKPAKATTSAKRFKASVAGWSSEGGWATKVPGAALRERPGEATGSGSKSARVFVATLPAESLARATEVMTLVDRANSGFVKKTDLDVKLALAWTTAVRDGLGWESIEVRDKAGRMGCGLIADPDRRWVIDPRELMRRLLGLGANRRCEDNTALLLYNMIAAGNLPPASPGDYLRIG